MKMETRYSCEYIPTNFVKNLIKKYISRAWRSRISSRQPIHDRRPRDLSFQVKTTEAIKMVEDAGGNFVLCTILASIDKQYCPLGLAEQILSTKEAVLRFFDLS